MLLQIVLEELENKGLVLKTKRGFGDDGEFVEHSEDWIRKYGPSKYWTDVK